MERKSGILILVELLEMLVELPDKRSVNELMGGRYGPVTNL